MTELSFPIAIIERDQGKPGPVWVMRDPNRGGISRRRFAHGGVMSGDIIDAAGVLHEDVQIRGGDIAWDSYSSAGTLGRIVAMASAATRSVLVKYQVESVGATRAIELKEAKAMLADAVSANPGWYTRTPIETLVGRIRRAKDFESMFRSFSAD